MTATGEDVPIHLHGYDHIQMDVHSIEESEAFYSRYFGYRRYQVGLRALNRWSIIGVHGSFLSLNEDLTKRSQPRTGPRLTHFGIVVEDFLGARRTLDDSGVELEPKDEILVYEGSRSFYFFDPNGHKIEVSEHWGGALDPRDDPRPFRGR